MYIFIFFQPIENIWTKIADKQNEEEVNTKKRRGRKKEVNAQYDPFFYRSNNNSNKRFNDKTE